MAIDTASYIGGMTTTIPANADKLMEGAGQIRAVKTATKNTFPNMQGRVEVSHTQLNSLFPLNNMTVPVMAIPGEVRMVYAAATSILPPWYVCDGKTQDVPNLMDTFPMFGSVFGTKGGANSVDIAPLLDSASTSITQAQLPNIKLNLSLPGQSGDDSNQSVKPAWGYDRLGGPVSTTQIPLGGVGAGHKHSMTKVKDLDNRPAFITLLPIMFKPDGGAIIPPAPVDIPVDIILQPVDQALKHADDTYNISTSWHVPEEYAEFTDKVDWILEEEAADGTWTEVSKGTGTGIGGITHTVESTTGKIVMKEAFYGNS